MTDIKIDQLCRIIESLVIKAPLFMDELKQALQDIFREPVAEDLLQAVLDGLKEKYSPHFYGMEFCQVKGRVFFRSRTAKEILTVS